MKKKIKKLALLLSGAMLLNTLTCQTCANALNPRDVLSNSLDELQQSMVDFMMLKQIVMKNVSVSSSATQEFCRQLDYDSNGSIDVMDMIAAKQKILKLSGVDDPYPNWPSESSVTTAGGNEFELGQVSTTPYKNAEVTQSEAKVTVSDSSVLKEGDTVTFTGMAYARPDGGLPTKVPYGAYKVLVILKKDPSYPYTVQLENTGWVSYQELTNHVQADSIFVNPTEPRIGDTVFYSGIAYYTMTGNGKYVVVQPGYYEISNIMKNVNEPYNVQLKNLGWVSYKDVSSTSTPSESSVTSVQTQPPVTTVSTTSEKPVSTASSSDAASKYGFNVNDTVYVNGRVYYSSKGAEPSYDISGNYTVLQILDESNAPYNVRTEKGWVSYRACKKVGTGSESVTTTAVSVVSATVSSTSVTTVSTAPVSSVSSESSDILDVRTGDMVRYKGKAYYSASGKGSSIDVDGIYKVEDILFGKDPYPVLLDKAGWVSYKDLTGKDMPVISAYETTVTTAAPADIKAGDKVKYSGKAYYSASGKGTPVDVNGEYEIIEILSPTEGKYTVLLDNAGWVSYKELTGKEQNGNSSVSNTTTAAVTTATAASSAVSETTPAVTTASSAVTQSSVKISKGETVKYKGKAYYSSKGTGNVVDLDGSYIIDQVLENSDAPYTVCLKGAGWVSRSELIRQNQGGNTVSYENRKFRIKNAASGRYLSYDKAENDSNVFQYSSGSDKGQIFTFKKYSNTDSYVLYTGDSSTYVLDIVKDPNISENDPNFLTKAITGGCNVDIYQDCDPAAQKWIIENIGNDRYKIASASNTKAVLMAYGFDNGSNDGKNLTSVGNIFLSEYENKDYQCWILEEVK